MVIYIAVYLCKSGVFVELKQEQLFKTITQTHDLFALQFGC